MLAQPRSKPIGMTPQKYQPIRDGSKHQFGKSTKLNGFELVIKIAMDWERIPKLVLLGYGFRNDDLDLGAS